MTKNEKNKHQDNRLCEKIYRGNSGSLFDITKTGRTRTLDLNLYAFQLHQLERFVDDLLSNDEIPFVPILGSSGHKEYALSHLACSYFTKIPVFIDVANRLSPKYEYSERIETFIACCHSLGLMDEPLGWWDIYSSPNKTYPHKEGISAAELFNRLVKEIRSYWKTTNIQAKANARKREADSRCRDYCRYADALFAECAKLLVLRVDLFYKKCPHNEIDSLAITEDLNHLLENKRGNSIFHFMKGYIAKLEYGADKGLHWHVLFFFDGSARNNSSHIHLAELIGEYWNKTITNGRGDYWNVNDHADRYDSLGRRGIGVIKWTEERLQSNLKNFVINYLCKTDQFIRPKCGPKVRLFRRGNYPKIPINKPGRPRRMGQMDNALH